MTTAAHEHYVARRFTEIADRFRPDLSGEDYRLRAVVPRLMAGHQSPRLLDLGCGRGRFARRLEELGATVVGLDASAGMLASGHRFDRVRGSALRLPFASLSFDGVLAVEVFEHLPDAAIDAALGEIARVLRPGGKLAIVDKNRFALDAARPLLPKAAVKWLDERRGLWMYPADAPVRERWFGPGAFARRLRRDFDDVAIEHPISPAESRRAIFRIAPRARLMTVWSATARELPR